MVVFVRKYSLAKNLCVFICYIFCKQGVHLPENLENGETSGNLRVVREKRKRQGKCVLAYGQLPRVLILTQNVQKGIIY